MAGEDVNNNASPPAAPVVLDLPLHHLIRGLQLQHGLRHGDYQRYRHYLTRRLQRLRKLAKATHKGGGKGKDRAFVAKDVHTLASLGGDAASLKLEHLLLLMLNTERAWAFAMQIKQDGGGQLASHVRAHLLRRFRRAAVWATRLQGLVGEVSGRVTERTALEVEAYAGWMAALVDVEQEQWAAALAKLRTAHSILSRLGEVGSLEDQDLFSNKAEEVLQSVRYCQYNLGEGSLEDLKTGADHVPQALRDKLEAVMEASRKQEATGLESVVWGGKAGGGRRIPVSSAEVRVALVKVAEASKGLEEAQEESQYAQMYAAYDEALRRVAAEKDKVETMSHGARVEAQKEELRLLASYLQHGRLETMRARNEGLVAGLVKNGRPEDLVHVYDALMQNVAEVLKLPGVEDVDPVLTKAQALQARYRAQRAFYLAEFYATAAGGKKLPEALALFDLADALAEEAVNEATEVSNKGEKEEMVKEARAIKNLAAGGRYRTQALSLLASLPASASSSSKAGGGGGMTEEAALAAAMASLSLSSAATAAAAATTTSGEEDAQSKTNKKRKGNKSSNKAAPPVTTTLLERLGELDGGKEANGFGIALVPPTVTAVGAKPQLFDIAFNYLDDRVPDLAAKAGVQGRKKKNEAAGGGGGGGGLFGWLRG